MLALRDRITHQDNMAELGLGLFRHQDRTDVAMLDLSTHEMVLEWRREATVLVMCNAGGLASMDM